MTALVYKILRPAEWSTVLETGIFTGSRDDVRDGFIHLSGAHQVHAVSDRHFAGEMDLVLLAFDPEVFGSALKWEVSHKGEAFPHLYGTLPLALVRSVAEIRRGTDGRWIFPSEIS